MDLCMLYPASIAVGEARVVIERMAVQIAWDMGRHVTCRFS